MEETTNFIEGEATDLKRLEDTEGITSFDELLDRKYGRIGEKGRDDFELQARFFVISEMLKETRKQKRMTQQQLADKVGTKKSYISRIERGDCDIRLSTLFRIFEDGLDKKLDLVIN